jgi:hypothetical protein
LKSENQHDGKKDDDGAQDHPGWAVGPYMLLFDTSDTHCPSFFNCDAALLCLFLAEPPLSLVSSLRQKVCIFCTHFNGNVELHVYLIYTLTGMYMQVKIYEITEKNAVIE